MKFCPTCKETYSDENLNFCLADGTTLRKERTDSQDRLKLFVGIGVFMFVIFGIVFFINRSSSRGPSVASQANLNRVANARPSAVTTSSPTPQMSATQAVVISENANLRKTDDAESEVLFTVPQGTTLEWIEQKGPWFRVRVGDKSGWMHGNTLRLSTASVSLPSTPTRDASDDIRSRIDAECARQAASGSQSPLCGEVQSMSDDEWRNLK